MISVVDLVYLLMGLENHLLKNNILKEREEPSKQIYGQVEGKHILICRVYGRIRFIFSVPVIFNSKKEHDYAGNATLINDWSSLSVIHKGQETIGDLLIMEFIWKYFLVDLFVSIHVKTIEVYCWVMRKAVKVMYNIIDAFRLGYRGTTGVAW